MTNKSQFSVVENFLDSLEIDRSKMLVSTKALAVVLLSTPKLTEKILPENMRIVSKAEDINGAITTVVNDDAFMASLVYALGNYILEMTDGNTFDTQEVSNFYSEYQESDDQGRKEMVLGALDNFSLIISNEMKHSGNISDENILEFEVSYQEIFDNVKDQGLPIIYETYFEPFSYALGLGLSVSLDKAVNDIESARSVYKLVGPQVAHLIQSSAEQVLGDVVRETFKRYLGEDDFKHLDQLIDGLDSSSNLTLH